MRWKKPMALGVVAGEPISGLLIVIEHHLVILATDAGLLVLKSANKRLFVARCG
jgi:hypothetical protein